MIKVLSTNITSPLGINTEQNYQAVKSGRSALTRYEGWNDIPEAFAASLFSKEQNDALAIDGYTRFESLIIRSIEEALSHIDIDVKSKRTILIVSTTKANVEELGASEECDHNYLHPGVTANKIAQYFGIASTPMVVSNACISGASAQITALRLLDSGLYDYAIACGGDCQSPFIVTGFQSFKALSAEECRPFDIERIGLNLGEAAATIIFGKTGETAGWSLKAGCANNDAYHISAPSPVGDGTYRGIVKALEGFSADSLATISVHGTATMFNDQMESKAIQQANLSSIPLSALKGYYGHTMGAAGLLETIITMRALDDGCILPTRGFEEIGVSGKVSISNEEIKTDKRSFLKIISGFGGCNGALLFSADKKLKEESNIKSSKRPSIVCSHKVHLTTSSLVIDDKQIETSANGKALLTEIYKNHIGGYPKFYKMDMLCRLVFVASEMLLKQESEEVHGEERAVVLFNRTSSIVSDRQHLATICNKEEFFPSPSVFLYTLPNIMTGEIAIKHSYKGETSLYILNEKNEPLMTQIIDSTMSQSNASSILTGWVDCSSENEFEAELFIYNSNKGNN